ncbi:hypothetical protein, partial [Pseudomonas syringae group genomosp. 7]|uniref:hypothetical protein n=1 Tax=Pseudomonas syringae group genomosp. 7 TaxID=251699 RepID=UPI003770103A
RLSGAGSRWEKIGSFLNKNDLTLENCEVLTSNTLRLGSAVSCRSNQVNITGHGTRLAAQNITLGTNEPRPYLTEAAG